MRLLPVCSLVCSVACGSDAPDSASVVGDSAGIQIVESRSPRWDSTARIDSEPTIRIGSEMEGPYQFGYLSEALLLEDGGIAAADFSAMELRLFDTDGEHIRTLGRRGRGPGEFQHIGSLFECGSGRLAVVDQRLRRLTIQPADGSDAEIHDVPVDGNQALFGCADGGAFLLYNPGQYRPELPEGLQWDSTDIVVWWPAGDSSRIIARLPVLERLIGPGGSRRSLVPAGVAVHAVADRTFYWATSDRYVIRRLDLEGRVQQILRRPVRPAPVRDSAYDAYVNALLEIVRENEGDAALPRYRQSFEEGGRGPTVPLFGTAFVDHDRRLWVSASTWPRIEPVPGSWTVFDEDGFLLGDLAAPAGVRIVDARGGRVLGIARNTLGVMSLQLHRIIQP